MNQKVADVAMQAIKMRMRTQRVAVAYSSC
jgi:hypothetical protein